MIIRDATPDDLPAIEPLFRAFEDEIPEPQWVDVDIDDELQDLAQTLDQGTIAVIAEDDTGHGLASRLMTRIVERLRPLGLDTVQHEVVAANENARAIYALWGFKEQELTLVTPLDELARHLGRSR